MIVGVIRLDLRLYDCHSLKQKRSLVNRKLQRLRTKFPVSVAEVGSLDLLQRALLGGTLVAAEEKLVQSVFSALEKEIEYAADVEIIHQDIEILHYGEKLD